MPVSRFGQEHTAIRASAAQCDTVLITSGVLVERGYQALQAAATPFGGGYQHDSSQTSWVHRAAVLAPSAKEAGRRAYIAEHQSVFRAEMALMCGATCLAVAYGPEQRASRDESADNDNI